MVVVHTKCDKEFNMSAHSPDGLPTEEKIKPKVNIFLTSCLYLSFLGLGLTASVFGPTLPHMEVLLQTDTKRIGFVVLIGQIGYTIGSVICGLTYDHFNSEVQFALVTLLMGAATAVVPWMNNLYTFFVAVCIQNVIFGYLDAGGQSYAVTLWINHRYKNPVMNALHAIFSVGATLAPLIASVFLVDLHEYDIPASNTNDSLEMSTIWFNSSETTSHVSLNTAIPSGITKVRYAYLVVGCYTFIPFMLFSIGFFIKDPSCIVKQRSHLPSTNTQNQPKHFVVVILILIFFFFACYICYEIIPGVYLTLFAYKQLKWDEHKAAWLSAVFWGFNALGRFIGIPLSCFLSPTIMLSINLSLVTVAFSMMVFVLHLPSLVMWLCVAMAGMGMGSTFASGVLWAGQYLHITGRVAAVLSTGASFGGTTSGPLAGYLFQTYSPMWIIYMCLIAVILHCILFIVMNVFVHTYGERVVYVYEEEISGNYTNQLEDQQPLQSICPVVTSQSVDTTTSLIQSGPTKEDSKD